MATGKTLNAANLEALGPAQLAALLIEISKGNAAAQRRLRLALAGQSGGAEAARAVTKRLISIAGAKTWLNWQKIKPFAAELEAQQRAVLDLVAPSDPREAFELTWRLVACAEPVFARSEDGSGRLAAVFHAAARDLGPLAQRAGLQPDELVARAVRVLTADGYGAWDELVPILAPQLGPVGLGQLQAALHAWRTEPGQADDVRRRRARVTGAVLQQIADARGDVQGYIDQFDARARGTPIVAAEIARRLLAAGRPDEAGAALDAVEPRQRDQAPPEWDEARIAVFEALGQAEAAQAFRWERFRGTLNPVPLRAHLRKLPDFDDFEAEQRALDHALAFKDVHQALTFLVAWPDLKRASDLVLGRWKLLNGDLYDVLSPAADTLDDRYPLAATLLRRAMIAFTLRVARSSRYRHAARQLLECRAAAAGIEAFGSHADHAAFERALRAAHGRKFGFWQAVDQPNA